MDQTTKVLRILTIIAGIATVILGIVATTLSFNGRDTGIFTVLSSVSMVIALALLTCWLVRQKDKRK